MAEKYWWCNSEAIVYKDDDSREYCVFHAPKGKKGISLEEFNRKVFEKINDVIKNNKLPSPHPRLPSPCNLTGTVFEGDISFSEFQKNNPLPEIYFSEATFSARVDFFYTTFSGDAHFRWVIFKGDVDFSRATFNGQGDFLGAIFERDADFGKAIFNGVVDFYGATCAFDVEQGWLAKPTAIFNGKINFSGATFSRGDFSGEIFSSDGMLERLVIKEKIRMEMVDVSKVSFLDTDLRRVDFVNCKWPSKNNREILYDEIQLFGTNRSQQRFKENLYDILIREWEGFKKDVSCPPKETVKKVEMLYRRLKQKYIDEHDWVEVSNWHYGEKEMFRKGSPWRRFFPLSISNLYWVSSGYGERPVRAGMVLGVLIIGISILMKLTGFNLSLDNPIYDVTSISEPFAYLLNTLQYVTFQKKPLFEPTSFFGEYLALFARVVIPIQTALFVFALRNRFRR